MADVVLQQILHTAGKEPLSTTSGALHTQISGTDGLALHTIKTDTGGRLVVSPDSALATEATITAIKTDIATLTAELAATKSELESIKANQLSGDQKVQLTGTIMEVHVLVNALAIVDTGLRTVNVSSVGKVWEHYSRFDFYVRNTLDSDIRIGFGRDHGYAADIPGKSGSSISYTPVTDSSAYAFHVVPPTSGSGSRPLSWYPIANPDVLDPLAYQKFVGVSSGSNLIYRAVTAPTKGSLSIWFVGWKV